MISPLWIFIGIFILAVVLVILHHGQKETPRNSIADEHSPENLKFDRALKGAHLLGKLREIENKRDISQEKVAK
jgi:hypothetical protein